MPISGKLASLSVYVVFGRQCKTLIKETEKRQVSDLERKK